MILGAVAGQPGCGFEGQGGAAGGADAGTTPDAPAVIPGPGDKDGDGLKDNVDNCPAAPNAAQYDEDGDRVGDVCDNCPHLANAGQENVGETGAGQAADPVGDACDPRPTVSKDRISLFLAYNSTADFAGWSVAGDQNFAVSGGALRNTTTTNLALAWRNDLDLRDATLVTKVKYTALSSTYQFRGFAVVGNFSRSTGNNALGSGLGCGELHDAGLPGTFFDAPRFSGTAFDNEVNGATTLAVDKSAVYSATLAGTTISCRAGAQTWTRTASFSVDDGIALSAWGAGVDIEYLLAFTIDD